MSFYRLDSATVMLERWSIRQTRNGARHFVGFSLVDAEGRVSTPISEFNPETGFGVTESGSRYQLVGRAGHDTDAEYVWNKVIKVWNVSDWTDVTGELVPNWRTGYALSNSSNPTIRRNEDL